MDSTGLSDKPGEIQTALNTEAADDRILHALTLVGPSARKRDATASQDAIAKPDLQLLLRKAAELASI